MSSILSIYVKYQCSTINSKIHKICVVQFRYVVCECNNFVQLNVSVSMQNSWCAGKSFVERSKGISIENNSISFQE